MIRLVVVILAMGLATTASAKVWNSFEIEDDEYYEYVITEYDPFEGPIRYIYALDFRRSDDDDWEDDLTFNVTTKTTQPVRQIDLQDNLLWAGFGNLTGFAQVIGFDGMLMLAGMEDLEFEAGERMTLLGLGRFVVGQEVTIAGRTGVPVRFEQGDQRTLFSEWVVDTRLPLPLRIRVYNDDEELEREMVLVKYVRH